MHELKRDYTLVIVTHNMQQAARVADMTAFFTLDVEGDGSRHGSRRVRRDGEDLHAAVRRAHRGLRHGTVRMTMRLSFIEELEQLEAALQDEGALVLRSLRASLNALARGDLELADEVIAFDDEVDAATSGSRTASSRCSRARRRSPATCGACSRSSASTCTSSGWPTTRHGREADEADGRPPCGRADRPLDRGDGPARRGDDPRRARLVRARDVEQGAAPRRPRRGGRHREPPRDRGGDRARRPPRASASGACGC